MVAEGLASLLVSEGLKTLAHSASSALTSVLLTRCPQPPPCPVAPECPDCPACTLACPDLKFPNEISCTTPQFALEFNLWVVVLLLATGFALVLGILIGLRLAGVSEDRQRTAQRLLAQQQMAAARRNGVAAW